MYERLLKRFVGEEVMIQQEDVNFIGPACHLFFQV